MTSETVPKDVPPLAPPIPCLICECPAFWISTYDLEIPREERQLRCCECDPPPGRSFVGSKWLVVVKADGKPAWGRFTRGGGDESPDLGDPAAAGIASSDVSFNGPGPTRRMPSWDTWVEIDLPDGSVALAPPGWRRLNVLRVEKLFGFNQGWKVLQRRTDAFFERQAKQVQ